MWRKYGRNVNFPRKEDPWFWPLREEQQTESPAKGLWPGILQKLSWVKLLYFLRAVDKNCFASGITFTGRLWPEISVPGIAAGTASVGSDTILVQCIRIAGNISVVKSYVASCAEAISIPAFVNLLTGIPVFGIVWVRVPAAIIVIVAATSPVVASAITSTHMSYSPLYKVVL